MRREKKSTFSLFSLPSILRTIFLFKKLPPCQLMITLINIFPSMLVKQISVVDWSLCVCQAAWTPLIVEVFLLLHFSLVLTFILATPATRRPAPPPTHNCLTRFYFCPNLSCSTIVECLSTGTVAPSTSLHPDTTITPTLPKTHTHTHTKYKKKLWFVTSQLWLMKSVSTCIKYCQRMF